MSNSTIWWVILVVVVLLGAYFLFVNREPQTIEEPTVPEVTAPLPTPTPDTSSGTEVPVPPVLPDQTNGPTPAQ